MAEHNFASLQARLERKVDKTDRGQAMPLTTAALFETDPIQRLEKLVVALETERLLAPAIVAEAEDCHGKTAQVETATGIVTVAFTDTEAMQRFNRQARPIPVSGRQQALLAMAETGGRLLINPVLLDGKLVADSGYRLPRPAVQALAHGDSWLPAWRDTELHQELQAKAAEINPVTPPLISVLADTEPTLKILIEFFVPSGISGYEMKAEVGRFHQELSKVERLQTAGERIEFIPLMVQTDGHCG
ncbi:SseB family protein [Gleimia sp. 6138-11-ORH1]|uniref:SseB family protein n=1 Tax=Gleimia sp. 6138-11-ORH1 TaxID=2973937 RepID=UPI002167F106|nr:SseB family protein [Gleimia sp. 6138-11-ORH1]MCS4484524.1 SseB family protein [Gleimia sp. 6138-11-ORH1]